MAKSLKQLRMLFAAQIKETFRERQVWFWQILFPVLLLVIFMVAAPVVNPGVVNLPSVANATPQQTQPPIVVTIKSDGTILARIKTGSGATEQKLANNNELRAFVKQRTDENPDQPVVIAADKSVQYDRVLTVMSVLKGDGVKRVGLMVKSS